MSGSPNQLKKELQQLQKELFDLSARNPFVNVNPDKLWFVDEVNLQKSYAQKIYSKARFFEKEYALKTSLMIRAFIEWKSPNSDSFFISPLLYQPCQIIEKKRIETTYELVCDDDELLVNPILKKAFADYFKVDLPSSTLDEQLLFESLQKEFSSAEKKLQLVTDFESKHNWRIIHKNAVGIFNYKKNLLHQDYKKIIEDPGNAIGVLFHENDSKKEIISPVKSISFDLDESQTAALVAATRQNLVIQGPPGTGKSHTVVSLINHFVSQHKKVLFVSEKRSALDVVYERLKQEKLDHLIAYFNTEKDEKKTFYAHLKKSWTKAIDLLEKQKTESNPTSFTTSSFDVYPKKLTTDLKNLGTDIHHLETELLKSGYQPKELICSGAFPAYKIWNDSFQFLTDFEETIKSAFQIKKITETVFSKLNGIIFSEPQPLLKLEKRIQQIEKSIQLIQEVQLKHKLKLDLPNFTRLAIAGSILGMVNKNQLNLIKSDHKLYKTFNTLAKKYELTKNKLTQIELVNKKWKKKPSISEITEITGQLKQGKKPKTILGILKRNSSKTYDYFSDFSSDISVVTKLQLLEEIRTEWHVRGDLEAIKIELKHKLNITHPDTEIDHILQVRSKLDAVSQNEYISILENENSLEMIRDLQEIHSDINQSNSVLTYLFQYSAPQDLKDLRALIAQLNLELAAVQKYQNEIQTFLQLPNEILSFIRANNVSIHQLNAIVIHNNLQLETRFEPIFKKLNGDCLMNEFETRKSINKRMRDGQLDAFRKHPHSIIQELEKLADTPASKLKPADKKRKQIYKDEKRILLHELNKKQQHLSIKNLSENCGTILSTLQPIWMMNPLSVAQHLRCEQEIFDVIIFDEASQIPLEDAIPAIYRAAKIIVVGDSQQMPPGQFFSANSDVRTLLDQASFAFQNVMLKGHYRSEHPALIEFSNRTFYENELITLPPISNSNPIELKKVEGIFTENKNQIEAKAIAEYYKQLLKSGAEDIGIIAFSKEQQEEIERQIQLLKIPTNEKLILRNLENVQGIEKEIILISIGYAKNENGIFRKNFGPVNQEKGANRLNVLFTRAIKKLVVFTSISSSDFKLTDNKGVTVLCDFLKFVENNQTSKHQIIPTEFSHQLVEKIVAKNKIKIDFHSTDSGLMVNCFIQHQSGKILLVDPCLKERETQDLYLLLAVLQKRFKKIKIVTSSELINNQERVEEELLNYF